MARKAKLASTQDPLLESQLAQIGNALAQAAKNRNSHVNKRISEMRSGIAKLDHSPAANNDTVGTLMQPANLGGLAQSPTLNSSASPRKAASDENHQISPMNQEEAGQIVDDPKLMLADLERSLRSSRIEPTLAGKDDIGLDELRVKLLDVLSPGGKESPSSFVVGDEQPAQELESVSGPEAVATDDQQLISLTKAYHLCDIATQLENGDCKWEEVAGWTKYLFGSGPNTYEEETKKQDVVKRAEESLDMIIKQTLEEEKAYRAAEDAVRLPVRIIVTNIAADAGEEDLLLVFEDLKFEINDIRFLDEREPIKRTRTAYVDMHTRESAKRASRLTGRIFGLPVEISLAAHGPE